MNTQQFIALEKARAEAVINASNGTIKGHEPTVDNHRGQLMAYQKISSLLEHEEITPSNRIKVERLIKITLSFPFVIFSTIVLAIFIYYESH